MAIFKNEQNKHHYRKSRRWPLVVRISRNVDMQIREIRKTCPVGIRGLIFIPLFLIFFHPAVVLPHVGVRTDESFDGLGRG
jgi:hypothetical protein